MHPEVTSHDSACYGCYGTRALTEVRDSRENRESVSVDEYTESESAACWSVPVGEHILLYQS